MAKFIDLLKSGKEMDCELIIGDVDMPASFVWDSDSHITDYGIERYKPILEAEYSELEDNCIEVHCEDWELGEEFCLAAAGHINNSEFERLFIK